MFAVQDSNALVDSWIVIFHLKQICSVCVGSWSFLPSLWGNLRGLELLNNDNRWQPLRSCSAGLYWFFKSESHYSILIMSYHRFTGLPERIFAERSQKDMEDLKTELKAGEHSASQQIRAPGVEDLLIFETIFSTASQATTGGSSS